MKSLLFLSLSLLSLIMQGDPRTANFPRKLDYVTVLPAKENFWIFIMAGQSNMAGRGLVEPQDTIPHARVLAMETDGRWYRAKEPFNHHEPVSWRGLDCGLSFGKELAASVDEKITIGVVHVAVGGTSTTQWINNETFRGIQLLSNFDKSIDLARRTGTIKGILWHQGESNANPALVDRHKPELIRLFSHFREQAGDPELPIVVGELGSFFVDQPANKVHGTRINRHLQELAEEDEAIYLVKTGDLTHRGDSLHFDSQAQRILGKRYAEKFLEVFKTK